MASSLNSDNGVVSGSAGLKSSADSSGVLDLQTNGTTAISISASQVVTYTNQPTYTGGTANGVMYLNGSKAVTTGTALVFDGTNLGVGTASPAGKLQVASNNPEVYITDNSISAPDSAALYLGIGSVTQYAGLVVDFTNDRLHIRQNQATRATFDSSGQFGIGTATPYSKLDLGSYGSQSQLSWHQDATTSYGTIALQNSSAAVGLMAGLKMGSSSNSFASSISGLWAKSAVLLNYGNIQFFTNTADTVAYGTTYTPTERARIDSGGNLMVNTTAPAQSNSTNNVLTLKSAGVAAVWGVGPTTSFGTFYISNVGTGVALSQGSTSWGTVSDERLKDIIEPITNAVSKVSSLRSVIGKYKTDADGTRRSFLIAQDVQAVLPEAIDVGEDEAQNLSIKYTETIPLLVAAIKELKSELDSVKTELAARPTL